MKSVLILMLSFFSLSAFSASKFASEFQLLTTGSSAVGANADQKPVVVADCTATSDARQVRVVIQDKNASASRMILPEQRFSIDVRYADEPTPFIHGGLEPDQLETISLWRFSEPGEADSLKLARE